VNRAAELPFWTGASTWERVPPDNCHSVTPSSKPGFCKRLVISSAWRVLPRDRMIIKAVRITIREIFNLKRYFLGRYSYNIKMGQLVKFSSSARCFIL
jgi:hypothetical protein